MYFTLPEALQVFFGSVATLYMDCLRSAVDYGKAMASTTEYMDVGCVSISRWGIMSMDEVVLNQVRLLVAWRFFKKWQICSIVRHDSRFVFKFYIHPGGIAGKKLIN